MSTCKFGDPTCPCQGGDLCHYVADETTPAMTPPDARSEGPHGGIVARDMGGYTLYMCADCGQNINNPTCPARQQRPSPPTFDSLLNDPTQQLDPTGEVLARAITLATPPDTRSEVEAPAGHRYGVMDGRGGQWLVEVCDEYPDPSPIGLVDDILRDAARHDADIAAAKEAGAAGALREFGADLNESAKDYPDSPECVRGLKVAAVFANAAALKYDDLRAALTTGGEGRE